MCPCLVAQLCLTPGDPLDSSLPSPLSMGLFRQEYWWGLPFSSSRDLPDPGSEPTSPTSPALRADSLPAEPSGRFLRNRINNSTYFFVGLLWTLNKLIHANMPGTQEALSNCNNSVITHSCDIITHYYDIAPLYAIRLYITALGHRGQGPGQALLLLYDIHWPQICL